MAGLSAEAVVRAWEAGWGQPAAVQATALLSFGGLGDPCDPGTLDIGERDARLLALREHTFGPRLECLAECPACGEKLEFATHTSDLGLETGAPSGEPLLEAAGVRFRRITAADLESIASAVSPGAAVRLLLDRIVGQTVAAGLRPDQIEAVEAALAEADPRSEILFDLRCPACAHSWQSQFDIATFFSSEIAALGRRLVTEVHTLARAYGWSEHEILALPARRRRLYLDLVGA